MSLALRLSNEQISFLKYKDKKKPGEFGFFQDIRTLTIRNRPRQLKYHALRLFFPVYHAFQYWNVYSGCVDTERTWRPPTGCSYDSFKKCIKEQFVRMKDKQAWRRIEE